MATNGNDFINGTNVGDSINALRGNDTVNGLQGNDTLNGNEGNDSLRGGRDNDSLSGGKGNDIVNGDLGSDTLSGGLGTDTLLGGTGTQDFFRFNSANEGIDVLSDYTYFGGEDDKILLSASGFGGGLSAGVGLNGQVSNNGVAADSNDRIIYDSSTGSLSFDADGTGIGGEVQFATLDSGLTLIDSDFTII
jgi:Ca2+-binding RTX toxin-like protein